MNLKLRQLMKLHRLHEAAGEHGSDGGGTGTGDSGSADAGGQKQDGTADAAGAAAGDDKGAQKPSDAEAKLLKDVMKHKGRASELEQQLSQVKEQLKQFEGIDVSAVRQLLSDKEQEELKKAEARGEYDRLIKQMGERHTTEKTTWQKQLEDASRAQQELMGQIANMTVGSAFTQSKFVAEDLTLTPAKARVIYGSHFEFKDGSVVAFDKPAGASERTMLVNAEGEALSFDEALKKLVDSDPDRDSLVRSKMKPGAGSSTEKKGVKKVDVSTTKMTGVDRIAAGLQALAKKS